MTEDEWLSARGPCAILSGVLTASERKLRLFACGCVRHVESLLWGGEFSKRAISIAEEFSDGTQSLEELARVRAEVAGELELYPGEPIYDAGYWTCEENVAEASERTSFYSVNVSTRPYPSPLNDAEASEARNLELAHQTVLLRDIFGNPFRPVAFDPAWRTSTAVAIAKGMYESRDFAADAVARGRAPGRRVRRRGHPRPLPRPRPAREGLLGRRSCSWQGMMRRGRITPSQGSGT